MDAKKKLTYVLHDIAIGGVEVALISAIPLLLSQFQLTIIVLGKINPKMIAHLAEKEQKVFRSVDYPFYIYPIALPGIVSQVLKTEPDLLVCSLWRSALVGIFCKFIKKDIRLFSFVHNTAFPHALAKYFNKRAAKLADVVLADSLATKQYVQTEFKPNAQVKVVSFLTRPTPATNNPKILDSKEEVRFMFLGRINRIKNLPAAIDLIQYLRDNSVPAILDIYGRNDDGTESALKDLVESKMMSTYIHFKGEVTGVGKWEIFKNYHFYVQLSFAEGMAMSVTEAMQNGLVCVVSPVGEIVNYAADMESAIFVDVFDKDILKTDFGKVRKVVNDSYLYAKIQANSYAYFSSKKLYADSLIEHLTAL